MQLLSLLKGWVYKPLNCPLINSWSCFIDLLSIYGALAYYRSAALVIHTTASTKPSAHTHIHTGTSSIPPRHPHFTVESKYFNSLPARSIAWRILWPRVSQAQNETTVLIMANNLFCKINSCLFVYSDTVYQPLGRLPAGGEWLQSAF